MEVIPRTPRATHPSVTPSPCRAYAIKFALDCTSAQAAFVRSILLGGIPTVRLTLARYEMNETNILFNHLAYQFLATTLLQTAPHPFACTLALANNSERNVAFTYEGSPLAPYVFAQSRIAVLNPDVRLTCEVETRRATGHDDANFCAAYKVAMRAVDYDETRLSLEQDPQRHEFLAETNGDRPPEALFAQFKTAALAHVAALANVAPASHPSGTRFAYDKREHFYQTVNSACELILDVHPELTLAFVSERDDGLYQLVLSVRDPEEAVAMRDKAIKALTKKVSSWTV